MDSKSCCVRKIKVKDFPYEIVNIDKNLNEKLLEDFTGEKSQFIQVGPNKYFFPKKYEEYAARIYNFEVRPDDIWIVTYPRSGTTWTQEMIWLLANNLDYKKAEIPLTTRFPFFEFSILHHPAIIAEYKTLSEEDLLDLNSIVDPIFDSLDKMKQRRFIKTHLPLELLPQNLLTSGAKVIYVARNAKDVAVSYFHLYKQFKCMGYNKDFPKFWDYFQNDLIVWSPYWCHLQDAWQKRNADNLLFIFYEEMSKDLNKIIRKVSNFLGVNYSDYDLKILEDHLSFESFRRNPSVNSSRLDQLGLTVLKDRFIRKGKTGGSKDYFEGDLGAKADQWIRENLEKTGIKFPE